jgi:hypothetical protein
MGNSMLSLIVCIAVGVVFYLGAAIIFRMPELDELKRLRK